MHRRLPLVTLALAAGLVGISPASVGPARAELQYVETIQVLPTASVVELPRTYSYAVPSSYLVAPTSAVLPSAFTANVYDLAPTSAIVPTSVYVPTSTVYVPSGAVYYPARYTYRGGRRRRRYYETAYVDTFPTALATTAYYTTPASYALAPTTVIAGSRLVATSSAICCETAAPILNVAPATQGRVAAEPVRDPRQDRSIESSVGAEPGLRDDQGRVVRDDGVNATTAPGGAATGARSPILAPTQPDPSTSSPTTKDTRPAPPAGQATRPNTATPGEVTSTPRDAAKTAPPRSGAPPWDPATPPRRMDLDPPGPAPIPSPAEEPAMPKDESRREAYKLVVPAITARNPSGRNVLEGLVVSADSRRPEEDVEVVLADRMGRYLDRRTRTDAYGRFAMTLPEGDWTIKLTMPSGRTLAVAQGQVTAASGKVLDMYGRDLTNLVIQR